MNNSPDHLLKTQIYAHSARYRVVPLEDEQGVRLGDSTLFVYIEKSHETF